MTISIVLAWITVLLAFLTSFKYITRKIGNKKLNRWFSKTHIPFGILFIVFGLLHGILAGNPRWSTLDDFEFAPVLLTFNWGTACFVFGIALGLTYVFKKPLKKKWMLLHRIFTIGALACILLHVLDTGIQLPSRIEEALDKSDSVAKNDNEVTTEADTSTTTNNSSSTFAGATLKDGTYEGAADGYKGTITVSVTVSNGTVSDISVIEENDTDNFFSRAKSILDTIIDNQTLQVDAVSGATFSSAGLINAVSHALEDAVISGELDINKIDIDNVERHGGKH